MTRYRFGLVPALAALLALPVAAALVAEVRDDAGFFKPDAIDKANQVVKSIKNQFKHDLLIETFKTVPAGQAEEFKKLDKDGKAKFYSDWARRRARDAEVFGVYVLICKEPGHITTEVGNETQKKAFTVVNRNRLDELLLGRFGKAAKSKDDDEKQKIHDQALLDAVNFVHDTFKTNLGQRTSVDPPVRPAEPHPAHLNERPVPNHSGIGDGIGGYLCIGLVALVGIWVVVGLVRSFSGGGGGMGMGGGGGGGFFSSLMGGMFGAAAGMWLYDSFFRGGFGGGGWGGSSAYGANPDGSSPQDTDYSGGGGDIDGGGGDTGGGDFGGGDTGGGGGDFGGGGGDFGGGGGDFGGGGGGGDF